MIALAAVSTGIFVCVVACLLLVPRRQRRNRRPGFLDLRKPR